MIAWWQRSIVSLALGFGVIEYAAAEFSAELGIERFRWREYNAGARLLTEDGPRLRGTVDWRHEFGANQRSLIEVRGSGYIARIDYDGQACTLSGVCTPFKTKANYSGRQVEGIFAQRFGASRVTEVFGGGGVDTWRRDIKGGDSALGPVDGAIEDWTVFYAVTGGGVYWGNGPARYHGRAGLKYPILALNSPDSVDVTLEPKGRLSFFARITVDFVGAGKTRGGFGIYYDSYRFAESDHERVGSIIVFQPQSRQDVIGAFGTVYF